MVLNRFRDAAWKEALSLLPHGAAWTSDVRSVFARLLYALGRGTAAVEQRVQDLLDEADPRSATEMLGDWERALGLPDECLPVPESTNDRRALVVSRAFGTGAASIPELVRLAAAIGVDIRIEEGRGQVLRVGGSVGNPVGGELGDLLLTVSAPKGPVRQARAGSARIGDPLGTFGNELLECVLTRATPAHLALRFTYDGTTFLIVFDDQGRAIRIELVAGELVASDGDGLGIGVPLVDGAIKALDAAGNPICVPVGQG